MTPFDAGALLAMLQAFYPSVSPEALVRARAERPEYFAGGRLIGRWPEVLLLPDGREFDLIFSVSEPERRRWQVIPAGGGAGAGDDFPLEPGPLTPIDVELAPPPGGRTEFQSLIGAALAELGGADDAIGAHALTMAEGAAVAPLEDAFAQYLAPARHALDEQLATLDALDPAEGIGHAAGLVGGIDDEAGRQPASFDEPEDLPARVEGLPPPEDEPGPGGTPPRA